MSAPVAPSPLSKLTRPARQCWQTRPIILTSLCAVLLTTAIVFVFGHKSFLVESELTLGIVAGSLLIFLTYGLYHGIRVDHEGTSFSVSDMNQWIGQSPDLTELLSVLDDLPSILWGLLVFLVLLILSIFFFHIIAIVCIAIFWLFNRALRQVFRHADDCHANLPRALTYACVYTLLYTGWLFILLDLIARALRH